MDNKALFVGIQADPEKIADVSRFLRGALEPVEEEPDTRDWYAIRFGTAQFAIFDTFPGNAGRLKHLLGHVGRSLILKTFTILDGLPDIRPADVLAAKPLTSAGKVAFSLHVPLRARPGQENAVGAFLTAAKAFVEAEPGTLSWYALRLSHDSFAIVDFFPDEMSRNAHLSGKVASALMAQADDLFAVPPEIRRGDVLASKAASDLKAFARA